MEKEAQPEAFSSIPAAMWWGLATLTTVGYGDVTPVTPVGKVFGAFIMVLGIAMFALPAGILATGFANEIRKREFVVTWRMVAAVPFFSILDALRISEIANLLEVRVVPPGNVVVHKGDKADSHVLHRVGHGRGGGAAGTPHPGTRRFLRARSPCSRTVNAPPR